MKHIEKLSYKYINTYGRFSQHRKSEEPIIDKINEIIDILQNKGLCKLRDKNVSQLIEIIKLNEEIDRLNNIINKLEKWCNETMKKYKLPLVKQNKGALGFTLPIQDAYQQVLDKLKALKENNK